MVGSPQGVAVVNRENPVNFRETILERPFWAALALLVGVRAALIAHYGVSFEISGKLWQLLDAAVLRSDPLRSLYYLHAQPPLFNGLFAAALGMPTHLGPLLLQGIYLLSSMVMVAIVHFFLRRFGYGTIAAAVGAAVFGLLPQVLVYENMFHYAHLEATLVLCAAYFAATWLSGHRLGAFVGLACCLVALALLRSLFHLGWIAFTLLAIWYIGRSRLAGQGRPALLVAFAAIAVVTALYAKNLKEFGIFSSSSWQGLNTASMTLPLRAGDAGAFPVVADDLRGRLARGEFSPAASLAFNVPNFWAGWVPTAKGCGAEERPVAALCAVTKANGEENYNNAAIIAYSRALGSDAVHGLRVWPAFYARRVASSFMTFFGTPSWSYTRPSAALKVYGNAWDQLLLFQPERAFSPGRSHDTGFALLASRFLSASLPLCALVLIGMGIIVARGIGEGLGYLRGRRQSADWVLPLFVVALFLVLPNFINGTETDRIRYSIEPLLLLALARGAMLVLSRSSRRRSGGST
jgi:hypothetical protein